MPKLVAAAIKFYPEDSEYPQIICGKRHCDCFEWMFNHKVAYDKTTHIQGFLTNTDQFVDRYEAMNMALDWGQVSAEDGYESGQQLYSEDLW
jgi:hypothetical protein